MGCEIWGLARFDIQSAASASFSCCVPPAATKKTRAVAQVQLEGSQKSLFSCKESKHGFLCLYIHLRASPCFNPC